MYRIDLTSVRPWYRKRKSTWTVSGASAKIRAAQDRREAPEERHDRREAEGEARAPEDEVLDGVEDGAARPLQGGRESGDGAREDREPPEVVDPARIEPERERARAQEHVGQEDAHRRGRRQEDEETARQSAEDRREGRAPAERPHQNGDTDRREERQSRDLAGGREPDGDSRQEVAEGARPVLRDPDGAVERRRRERRQERVDGPEVRELDPERAEGRQSGGDERGSPVREAPRDPVDEPDGQQVEDPGQGAPDEVSLPVALLAEERRHGLRHDERQRPVDERALAAVVRVESRFPGVEVVGRAPGKGELLFDHRDETLVRVEVVALVPVELLEAEERPEKEDPEEDGARAWSRQANHATRMPLRERKRAISSRFDWIQARSRSTPSAGETRGRHARSRAARSTLQ